MSGIIGNDLGDHFHRERALSGGAVRYLGQVFHLPCRLATYAHPCHKRPMDQSATNAICAAFTGATLEFPFGPEPNVWKVGNKIFAITNAPNGVSLKCSDAPTADLLIDMGRVKKAPYLPRGGWVLIEWNTMEKNEVADRLATSYATVRSSLTKKAQAELS